MTKKDKLKAHLVQAMTWLSCWGLAACSDGLSCKDDPEAPGVWVDVGYPNNSEMFDDTENDGAYDVPAASDGKSLILLGQFGCDFCRINVLDPVTMRWRVIATEGEVPFSASLNSKFFAASEEYLFVHGGIDHSTDRNRRVYSRAAAVLDRSTREWTVHEPPEEFRLRFNHWVFWTGEEFLIWGGDGEGPVAYLDGVFFNPKEGTWRYLPPLAPDIVEPRELLYRSVSATWTARGLVVWGGTPNDNTPIHALYSVEQQKWIPIEVDASFERLTPGLLGYGDDLYFYSGSLLASGDGVRDLWRYSLSKGTWTEIQRADYADLTYAQVVGNKFVFWPAWGSCLSGSMYDPKTDTWSVLTSKNRPPTIGQEFSASGRFLAFGAHKGEYPTYRIWVLDPEGDAESMGGAK